MLAAYWAPMPMPMPTSQAFALATSVATIFSMVVIFSLMR